jgi:fatty acid-binding protein DegV
MPHIAIITDTDPSPPGDLAKRYQVHLVPMTIHFGEDSYEAGVDIDDGDTFSPYRSPWNARHAGTRSHSIQSLVDVD